MEFVTKIYDDDRQVGCATVTSFRQVTVFGKDYTKIVYMHSEDDFTIERIVEGDVNVEDMTQVISGPRASEIIQTMLELEKPRGSTFVWNGVHFKNKRHRIKPDEFGIENKTFRDPLAIDPIEPEVERRKYRRRKEDREAHEEES